MRKKRQTHDTVNKMEWKKVLHEADGRTFID